MGFIFFHQSKILRVLNLWQKNGVFDMDIIQPLMDMANGAIIPPPALQGREITIVWAGFVLVTLYAIVT